MPDVGAAALPCTLAPRTPTSLGDLEGTLLGSGIALVGDRVFVGVNAPDVPLEGQIVGFSLSTGARTIFRLGGNIPAQLTGRGEALFYSQGAIDNGYINYTHVARLDLQTGQVSLFDNPPDLATSMVQSVVGNANGDIFWVVSGRGTPQVLMGWDPSTDTANTLLRAGSIAGLLADTATLYWMDDSRANGVAFLSMPVGGGPTSVVESFVSISDWPSLLAVDDEHLYYTILSDTPPGIMAMPKTGGAGKTIVPNAQPAIYAIDDTHIYWVNYGDYGEAIYRAPKDGGDVETVWASRSRRVMDLAVDACNIYWTANNEVDIYARAK